MSTVTQNPISPEANVPEILSDEHAGIVRDSNELTQEEQEQNEQALILPDDVERNLEDDPLEKTKWEPWLSDALALTWKHASVDEITGNEQKGDAFWKEVSRRYHFNSKVTHSLDIQKLKNRWQVMSKSTSIFVSALARVMRLRGSEEQIPDLTMKALGLYVDSSLLSKVEAREHP
ncbi:hypothetical protein MBANPS3_012478 [Mucor bainieri]